MTFKAVIICMVCFSAATRLARAADSCMAAYGTSAVEQFLQDLQKGVAADERTHVVQMIEYPVTIKVGNKPVRLRRQSELLKLYDIAFDEKVKAFSPSKGFQNYFATGRAL